MVGGPWLMMPSLSRMLSKLKIEVFLERAVFENRCLECFSTFGFGFLIVITFNCNQTVITFGCSQVPNAPLHLDDPKGNKLI